MSTGKRLAKRSILGTRVACCLEDGKYYPGVICDVKSLEEGGPSVYSVRVEGDRRARDLREGDLVGSGFTAVNSVKLRAGQKVFITFNNREVSGNVIYHRPNIDEVLISVINPETSVAQETKKRLEEVRLLESRKSARLADTDTDFAKLADCTSDRTNRKTSSTIDVPGCLLNGSRKRRGSRPEDDGTDECAAALVLMKLSCSPRSPLMHEGLLNSDCFSGASSASSGVWSWGPQAGGASQPQTRGSLPGVTRSTTPSPPLSDPSPPPPPSTATDDGIDMDDPFYDDIVPRKRRSSTRVMFKCTWKDCAQVTPSCPAIEQHIRTSHLGLSMSSTSSDSDSDDDHEEEFYWTEVEVNVSTWVEAPPPQPPTPAPAPAPLPQDPHPLSTPSAPSRPLPPPQSPPPTAAPPAPFPPSSRAPLVSSPPTLSHMDMARPPHEDPDYRRHHTPPSLLSSSWPRTPAAYFAASCLPRSGKTSRGAGGSGSGLPSAAAAASKGISSSSSSTGRGRRSGESRKCRKVYGMEQKEQWCTQCKWKKACSRFGE